MIYGFIDDEPTEFSVGIGKTAQAKHEFQVGDEVWSTPDKIE
jgi:hypothetical protein